MSIAIVAPEKFEFQDAVCVEMMLRFEHVNDACFVVEPKGGEDGELRLPWNGNVRLMEIQVKGSARPVTLSEVAACLAHTPPRTEKNTLLERLLSDPQRLAVLVMSGRCNDSCAAYAVEANWDGAAHALNGISRASVAAFLDAFSEAKTAGGKNSPIKARRRAHNRRLVATADENSVRKALARVIVVERVDAGRLKNRCATYLRERHRIPDDQTGDVLRRLAEDVKNAKGKGTDALALVRKTLERASPANVRPDGYEERGVERELRDELNKQGVILLSGKPRVGKSYTARWIAAEFQSHGYRVQEHGEIDEVERFLLEPTSESRLSILDDPLGGRYGAENRHRTLARIDALIPRLRNCRKLIVAQGEPLLLEVSGKSSLSSVSTGNREWRNLGRVLPDFLARVWRSSTDWHGVPDGLREFVSSRLSDGSLVLETGCVCHLAANHKRLGDGFSIEAITRLARENAADMGLALAKAGAGDLLAALVLTTSRQERIDLKSLAFVMGEGGSALPSKSPHGSGGILIGGPPRSEPAKPRYEYLPSLSSNQSEVLDLLERLRVVEVDAEEHVNFTHPYYRAAAESLVNGATHSAATRIASTMQRGLFCMSPVVTQGAARNLDWAFERLASRAAAQTALVSHAIDGLKSFFPATRDLCFRFLARKHAELPDNVQSNLPRWTSVVAATHLERLEWTEGHAHFPFDARLEMDQVLSAYGRVDRSEVEEALSLLDGSQKGHANPEQAAAALRYFAHESQAMGIQAMGRLLSFDEAVIRAEATKIWLSKRREDDIEVFSRAFSDDHPRCAVGALQGAIAGWREYSARRRKQVLDGLSTFADSDLCATTMLDRLVRFNRVEDTGEDPPWTIFGELVPIILKRLPGEAIANEPRLSFAMNAAAQALQPAAMVAICEGWIGWLRRCAQNCRLPSAFALGVGKILVASTRDTPELRDGMIGRMLSVQGTGAQGAFVADLVDNWRDLVPSERNEVLRRLLSGRSDDVWLQAVALTRTEAPRILRDRLLGEDVSLGAGPDVLRSKMDPALLKAAVHVYVGHPQPLYWIGTSGSGRSVWKAIIDRIATTPSDPCFELAWSDIASAGDGARLSKVIARVGNDHADRMLDLLLRIKLRHAGDFMPEAWATLLGMAPNDDIRQEWIDRMAYCAPAILTNLSDLRTWLTEKRDYFEMQDRLMADYLLLRVARYVLASTHGTDAGTIRPYGIRALEVLLDKGPPQIGGTCNWLIEQLKRRSVAAPALMKSLQSCQRKIDVRSEEVKREFAWPEYDLPGWIAP